MRTRFTEIDFYQHNGTRIERVPVVVTEKQFPKENFENMFRAPFGGRSRWYFRFGENEFYSGLTGALSQSGLVDKSFIHKKSKELALEGIDSDELWGERADYGSCVHLIWALHERGELEFEFDDYSDEGWRRVMWDFIEDNHYFQYAKKWEEDIQNDMAAIFKWKSDYRANCIATELMVRHDDYRIATPLDFICAIDFGGKRILANVNLKTGDKSFWDSSYMQVAYEMFMFNRMMPVDKYKLSGTFLLRPKSRARCTGDYAFSKNCADFLSQEQIDHIGRSCRLSEIYKPNGKVKIFSGKEGNYIAKELTPYEWLKEFNEGDITFMNDLR